jgi:hypothetical protein
LTQLGLEHTIYCTRGEHAIHYATDAVYWVYKNGWNFNGMVKYQTGKNTTHKSSPLVCWFKYI